ncbi:hypothetical protein LCGC14_0971980 [marine sediment metagenome]|uniref:Radical SAM core domain-containing protein n=1 Tax=marine sediment metagenome TaxID=412755 RepID=A0A0F9RHS3_9ZZZZ
MMNKTPRLSKSNIEYLDYVWNFASGCTKGCTHCYAKKIATRFPGHYPDGFEPTLYPEALTSPLRLKKPSVIGVVFMGDLFDDAINPYQFTGRRGDPLLLQAALKDRIFETIEHCPQHRFLFLTKQPQNLAKWAPFPDNCWVGVSVTDDKMLREAHEHLLGVEARVKYLSFEPLLTWDWQDDKSTGPFSPPGTLMDYLDDLIDWLIIGAQTKPTVMPKVEWVREIVEAADAAGIPVFLKDSLDDLLGWKYRPDMIHLRQEMPNED